MRITKQGHEPRELGLGDGPGAGLDPRVLQHGHWVVLLGQTHCLGEEVQLRAQLGQLAEGKRARG